MDELHRSNSAVEDGFESTLHSAPSFAIYNNSHDENEAEEVLKRTCLMIGGENLESTGSFSFGKNKMGLIEEGENENDWSSGIQNLSIEEEEDGDVEPPRPHMYLAAALGVDGEVGSDKIFCDDLLNPNLQEIGDLEGYYKKMVEEYPFNPLVLQKYAQLLQSSGDLKGAEQYFLRATQADPNDGEILMQYAKLIWENYHDKDRALVYFERAAQAAPRNSHVLAAYTSFLWETEDDENEGGNHEIQSDMEKQNIEGEKNPSKGESDPTSPFSILEAGQEIDAANITEDNVEDYFKKMIDEYPNNPLFLKKYAQFLVQSKRDLQAAEDYYSRAIVADPGDGETISEYAKLVWELHHDLEKASLLLEQAVRATPGNSNVLAAYACFLWETEDAES